MNTKSSLASRVALGAVLVLSSSLAWSSGSPPPEDGGPVLHGRWEGKHADGRDWSVHTYDAVSEVASVLVSTVPSDYREFCPDYPSLSASERKNFWMYLLSAMAQYESNFRPALTYRESFRDSRGNYVVSRGLLQLSIESGNGYGCGLKQASDLHDPYTNLECGLRILGRWVARDKRIAGNSGGWKGGARYWSVLRTGSRVNSIKGWTKAFCAASF
jgi:hypothetical protein